MNNAILTTQRPSPIDISIKLACLSVVQRSSASLGTLWSWIRQRSNVETCVCVCVRNGMHLGVITESLEGEPAQSGRMASD